MNSTSTQQRESSSLQALRDQAEAALSRHLPEIIELRHRIHQEPEVSGQEFETPRRIAEFLGIVEPDWLADGFLTRFGPETGPAIAIRAELDALPIQEQSSYPWASTRPGVAHLCGHDVHMTALAGAARALQELDLPVALIPVFQPREEVIPSGAEDFVKSPLLTAHDIRAFLGFHVQPTLPDGTFSAAPGPINAAADNFSITIHGTPAHGAYPHKGRDSIVAAAALISSLQHLVSRRSDPISPSVITVGTIHGGESSNAIGSSTHLTGTIRTFSDERRTQLHEEVRTLSEAIALGYDCRAEVDITWGEPVLNNDPQLSQSVSHALAQAGFIEAPPWRSYGADDFSYYSALFPSLMVFTGVGEAAPDSPSLHHPQFVPHDDLIQELGIMMIRSFFAVASAITNQHTSNSDQSTGGQSA